MCIIGNRMQTACEQAAMSTDLKQLPQGLNTLVGERGVTLSGGQQMRVAIARAFYQRKHCQTFT